MNSKIYLGDQLLKTQKPHIEGEFVSIQDEKFYKITNYDFMPDFFMTIISDSDHWMFLSSNGSLSAGRKNRDNALFPYYTVDKIHDYKNLNGSKTYCLVEKNNKTFLWEPFTDESSKIYSIKCNLYKSIYGNKIIFEEINSDLGVSFQYGWYNSEKFGWIKKSVVSSQSKENIKIELLDGIQNILPYGVDYSFQNEYSNLLDAYKKNELLEESGLGLFMLSSIPVDRAEPSEALKTTTVWSHGLESKPKIIISNKQIESFKRGEGVETEIDIRASRGAYYINTKIELKENEKQHWFFAAEVNQDASDVVNRNLFLKLENNIEKLIDDDIKLGTKNLIKIVACADGVQLGNEDLSYARHFSNTLFNIMRGGIFTNNYQIDIDDFALFVRQTNNNVFKQFSSEITQLPNLIEYTNLVRWANDLNEPELLRICYEYLPLTFSRRHGDPSRPWNIFSIETKNNDGSNKLSYQGNWRDIFQNWEALSLSFPEYLEGMISKFLNASSPDGYNPYRITREGIDWESPNPDDAWSYIGYWGDHQIIYLQKFLELSNNFHLWKLDELMTKDIFVFANIPYRIKSFNDIVQNPKDTITFDHNLNSKIEGLVEKIGADGRLLHDTNGNIIRTNLSEKILITLLAKLSNFIPEAGIWLNTQRPEWNDANNALVGNGVSMVTLYYLRRFLKFWETKFSDTSIKSVEISEEVKTHFDKTFAVFVKNTDLLEGRFSDEERYNFTKVIGDAGSEYRLSIYNNLFSGKKEKVETINLLEFIQLSLKYIDHTIKVNKRNDGLFHAYNLISFKEDSISIRYLYEMLEGQVAVLSSGYLSTLESLKILNALKASKLYRANQFSYLLYPDRELARFLEKNNINKEQIQQSTLLQNLINNNNDEILKKDDLGNFHLNGSFRNSSVLDEALENLNKEKYGLLVKEEKKLILSIFEDIFDHQSFTGRSGTFYGYEGLGSIYWHMVSKLLVAVQESYFKGVKDKVDIITLSKIKDHYYEIKAGIGLYKSPEIYGAFPTDAYSHTPANAGVKQPGLTGQVKEDVISRMGELGIQIKNGEIHFMSSLINHNELLKQSESFDYYDLYSTKKSIQISNHQMGFTFCQVPIIYTFSENENEKVIIVLNTGERVQFENNVINNKISSKIFKRSGEVERIEFYSKA